MIYVILGQTASGKTSLATKICRDFNMPLINADAYQCYQELNVGTAKPSEDELEGIEHYFINCRSIKDPIDVKQYQEEGRKIISKLIQEGKDIVISGGTSLYIKGLLYNYIFPDFKEEDRSNYEEFSLIELQNLLKELDPNSYEIVDLNNRPRLINAIMIAKNNESRENIISKNNKYPLYPCLFYNIDISNEEIASKINSRVEEMFASGLVEEVKNIIDMKVPFSSSSLKVIGYKEFFEYENLNFQNDQLKEIEELIKVHTRQYSKRQRTFIRHQFTDVITASKERIYQLINIDQQIKHRTRNLIGNENMFKIENQRVLLFGVGGVGSVVSSGLTRLGVKKITVFDDDKVNITNLNRQIMYDLDDLDKFKVNVIKEKCSKINPNTLINSEITRITKDSDLESYQDATFIFDCIDSVEGKMRIFEFSRKHNIPLIISGGVGKKIDSTKLYYDTFDKLNDPLSRKLKENLIQSGYNEEDFSKVFAVSSKEGVKKTNSKEITSIFNVPNSAGITMITKFILEIIKGGSNYEFK